MTVRSRRWLLGQAAILSLTGVASTRVYAAISHAPAGLDEGTPTPPTKIVSVYFMRKGKIGAAHREIEIPEDKRVATATLVQLLKGPSSLEKDAGLNTEIPKGVDVLGLSIDDATEVATVNLSQAFYTEDGALEPERLAQIVFTLTQFPNVKGVELQVDGDPTRFVNADGKQIDGAAGRADYERLTPLIFLESPAPGDTIFSPVRLWGTANTFEAEFRADILSSDGAVLTSQMITATSGNGTRGDFDVTIPFEITNPGQGKVVVYENSARDGGRDGEVSIPVELKMGG